MSSNNQTYLYIGGSPEQKEGEGVTHVIVEDGVESIDDKAFRDWRQLVSIHIPPSVKRIGGYAFYGCISLILINLPDSLQQIGECAFLQCESLSSITLPVSLNEIGECAFYGCISLILINLPDSLQQIGGRAFHSCVRLSSINLPDSLNEIGERAFYGCTSLNKISIPPLITRIHYSTFDLCSSLSEVIIPPSLIEIGGRAFARCRSLKSIKLPNGLQTIGHSALNSCTSLESIQIPTSTTAMDRMTFYDCSSMKVIYAPSAPLQNRFRELLRGGTSFSKVIYTPSAPLQNRSRLFVNCDPILIILTDVDGFEYYEGPSITLNNINQCIQDLPNNPIPPNQQLQTLHQVLQQRFPNIAHRAQHSGFTLLHLIVYFPEVIYEPLLTLLTKCPEVIKAVDSNGKTPIHHVITSTRHNMHPNCYNLLMRHCPDRVVHQAIRAGGLYWDDLHELVEAKSNALTLVDVESRLLPFMLAATPSSYRNDNVDLNVVYELLSMDPGMLKDYL